MRRVHSCMAIPFAVGSKIMGAPKLDMYSEIPIQISVWPQMSCAILGSRC